MCAFRGRQSTMCIYQGKQGANCWPAYPTARAPNDQKTGCDVLEVGKNRDQLSSPNYVGILPLRKYLGVQPRSPLQPLDGQWVDQSSLLPLFGTVSIWGAQVALPAVVGCGVVRQADVLE